ncbi:MAG: hypothetical protein M0008_05375 [Actinomycetota bacterium]|nr:hypothetical protein [Actinomycetota bacterium]
MTWRPGGIFETGNRSAVAVDENLDGRESVGTQGPEVEGHDDEAIPAPPAVAAGALCGQATRHSKVRWPKIIIGATLFVITLPDLVASGLPMHGDMSFPTSVSRWLGNFMPLWDSGLQQSNLPSIDRFWATTPFLWAGHLLGVSLSTMYKLYLLASLLLAAYAMYFLVRAILSEVGLANSRLGEASSVIAGLIFALSPWAAQQYQAPFYYLAYAGTPALALLLYRYLGNGNKRLLVLVALVFSVMASTPQYTIFTAVACLVLVTMALWQAHRLMEGEARREALKVVLRRFSYFVGVVFVANLYWLVPGFLLSADGLITPGYRLNVDMLKTLSAHSSMFDVLIGRNLWVDWYHPVFITGTVRTVLVAATPVLAIVLALFVTYRLRPRSLLLRWCYPMGIVAMLVSAWPAVPVLRRSYYFFVLNMPLGWVLRVPEKVSYLWWVAEPVFLAVGITVVGHKAGAWLAQRLASRSTTYPRIARLAPFIARSAGALAILVAFGVTSGVNSVRILDYYYKPIVLPTAYSRAFAKIASLRIGQGQVFDLAPYYAGQGQNSLRDEASYTWNPSRIIGYGVAASIPARTIAYYHMTTPLQKFAWWAQTLAISNPKGFLALMQEADVHYVLFHNDVVGAQATGAAQLKTLQRVAHEVGSYGSGVYLFRIPGTRKGFTLSAAAPPLWGHSLVSALTSLSPTSPFIVRTQSLLPSRAKVVLAKMEAGRALGPRGYSSASPACSATVMGMSQVLGDASCTSRVIAPAQVDSYATSNTHWNSMRTMAPMDSGLGGWDSAILGAGLADNGLFDMNQGVIMASGTVQGQVSMTVPFDLRTAGTYLLVARTLVSPVGGGIDFSVDGTPARSMRTIGSHTRFEWVVAGSFQGRKGANTLRIENYTGTNALNIVSVLSKSQAAEVGLWLRAPPGLVISGWQSTQGPSPSRVRQANGPRSVPLAIAGATASSFSIRLPARHSPELLTTDMPCQVGWQVSIARPGNSATPAICVDGFWTGAVIPAGAPTMATVVYGPETVWVPWMVASIVGFLLIVLFLATGWAIGRRREGAALWFRRNRARGSGEPAK